MGAKEEVSDLGQIVFLPILLDEAHALELLELARPGRLGPSICLHKVRGAYRLVDAELLERRLPALRDMEP